MENLILSVSDAIAVINQTLDYAYPTLVVEGEVAGFKVNQGKYVFFDVKDDTGTVGCFMMLFQLRQPLEDGMRVRVVASPKITAWGKFSLTVREVRPVGEGSLKRAFELLREKLEKEGLFASERKRALPDMPERIGLISSTGAAGYADFVRILDERFGGVRVEVAQVQVQGTEAPQQIIRALSYFNSQPEPPDVIAIVRGGGSADDLSAFNDESLVRAIAASRVPTIVGVGHEVDQSLADMAADVRAATPSHAAQLLLPDKQEVLRTVQRNLVVVAARTETAVRDLTAEAERSMITITRAYNEQIGRMIELVKARRTLLDAYDPNAVLARGYAIIRGTSTVGSSITIEQAKRYITAEVTHVKAK
ncbi:MAG TPA: exodeoxyribonuclease VII large subunit [Candidatus Saccharibacteria bacterium]|nr:exodeoxyribonuclease VII large subunit [Candidatus Saccharibacteria bacterium]